MLSASLADADLYGRDVTCAQNAAGTPAAVAFFRALVLLSLPPRMTSGGQG